MSRHSVVQAKKKLSELIDRALMGERIIITRHGRPTVELKPMLARVRPVSIEDLDWLAARRVGRTAPIDAGSFLSQARDEDER